MPTVHALTCEPNFFTVLSPPLRRAEDTVEVAIVCELLGRFRATATGLSKQYIRFVAPYLSITNDENLMALLRRMVELREEEEQEWRPSDTAYSRTVDLLADMCVGLGRSFPRALASVDGEGGIRMTWRRPSGEVRLVVPGRENVQPYLYYQTATERGIVESITGRTVANFLDRINH